MGSLGTADRHSPLTSQLEAKTRDLDWTLAHFTFVADVTALATECDVAHSPAMSVASCHALPTLGLAFVGESPDLLATYAAFLADPGSEVSLLVDEAQRAIVECAFTVESVAPKWQMVFQGNPDILTSRQATPLTDSDLPAVRALARMEQVPLLGFSDGAHRRGPAFGVWDRRKLVAIGTTVVSLPGVAQIDNVLTRKEYRRRGYGTAVVAALLRAHHAEDRGVFAVVDQGNVAILGLLEKLGFVRERPMYAMTCILGTAGPES